MMENRKSRGGGGSRVRVERYRPPRDTVLKRYRVASCHTNLPLRAEAINPLVSETKGLSQWAAAYARCQLMAA